MKIKLRLEGLDGNAFSLMGAFSNQARREGWTSEQIKEVLDDAQSGDYDHLLQVLIEHCEDPGELPPEGECPCDTCIHGGCDPEQEADCGGATYPGLAKHYERIQED